MEAKIYKLTFRGPVHFGEGRLWDSSPTCDAATLFSAFFIEALDAGREGDLLEAALNGGLLLSDAFPFVGDELYLPKPMLAPHAENEIAIENSGDSRVKKAFKKLSHVPLSSYRSFCVEDDFDALGELERFDLGAAGLRMHVNLERVDGDAEPYAVGGYTFEPGAGIYFIVAGGYDVSDLVERLQYSGIGGRRTSGYGRFAFEEASCPIELGNYGDGARVLLSTAAPSADELNEGLLDGARYSLVRKGGFAQTANPEIAGRRKRASLLFKSGSVFHHSFCGDVLDVSCEGSVHPVYRYARAMWMEV